MALSWVRLRDRRRPVLVFVVGVSALLALALLTRAPADSRDLVPVSQLLGYGFVLAAAGPAYVHWRLSSAQGAAPEVSRQSGWLTVGLVVVAVHGLVDLAAVAPTGHYQSSSLMGLLAVVVVLCAISETSRRVDVPLDPALLGTVSGLAVSFAVTSGAAPVLSAGASALLMAGTAAAGFVLAGLILGHPSGPRRARRWLAHTTLGMVAAVLLTQVSGSQPGLAWLAIAVNVTAAVAAVVVTQSLLRGSLRRQQRELSLAHQALHEHRTSSLNDRELIHEISSAVAGIVNASQLVRMVDQASVYSRERLQELVDAELARLQRLLTTDETLATREFDVDEVVGGIVLSHQARGRQVTWHASGGLRAQGDPDDLAEVVDILLENGAQHGRGVGIVLSATHRDGSVELTYSDEGPGIAPEVGEALFERGRRGPDSGGQGLGLGIARRLMRELGGDLVVLDTTTRAAGVGAAFVARMPSVEVSRDVHDYVA